MKQTYLTTDELSALIKYDPRTIRECMKDSVLLEGVHYLRPFGGRKILYIWENIERDMGLVSDTSPIAIPMANGRTVPAHLVGERAKPRSTKATLASDTSPEPSVTIASSRAPTQSVGVHKKARFGNIPMANGGICHG